MTRLAALVSLFALALLFATSALAPAAHAQQQEATGAIVGTVVNSQTGEPMGGVRVTGPRVVRTSGGGYDGPCWTPPRRRRVQLMDTTDVEGAFRIEDVPAGKYRVAIALPGQRSEKTVTVEPGGDHEVRFTPSATMNEQDEVVVTARRPDRTQRQPTGHSLSQARSAGQPTGSVSAQASQAAEGRQNVRRRSGPWNRESYDRIEANEWKTARSFPLSTFSIDVDAASYSNARRMLCEGRLPPKDAVRIEELVNYFDYDYPQPSASGEGNDAPFSITTEAGAAPWNADHRLVHVGLQGRTFAEEEAPPSNLVFLLDVSGSMRSPRKLPLLKQSFQRLTERLGPRDRVAIVVYAGSSGLVLESTPGDRTAQIQQALGRLQAGGSTAGAAGIELAYEVAQENFISGGNNRVILATDGDFNVGPSSDAEMTRLIEEKRESGVFLTTLGLGTGNLQDAKMEALANKGNGNYFYLDAPREAKKVLGRQLTSTLHTIAKDVKIQVEFNPTEVERYRLIGYANRQLDKEDFADDSTDAGELGRGHTVTALYEVVPGSKSGGDAQRDDLRYQTDRGLSDEARSSGEMMQVRLRYKQPDGDTSRPIERAVPAEKSNAHPEYFSFSAAVVGFGMLLRDSEYRGDLTTDQVLELARDGRGDDPYGDRAEFIQLVERFRRISQQNGERSVSQQR
jgi:Ca-activated chloride channel family protein